MKVVIKYWVLGTESGQYKTAVSEIETAIEKTRLVINPTKKGNGVKPIKNGVIDKLKRAEWSDEHPMDLEGMRAKPLDAFKKVGSIKVGFEWETGNISSSFRALMKLIKGLIEGELDLGVHVLPSKAFYNFLTDRVGNITELEPYLSVFGKIQIPIKKSLLIVVVEHDAEDTKVPLIPKGLDGMSIGRRTRND
jgi:hypothetical protein